MTGGHNPTEINLETKIHILTNKEEIPMSVAVITSANTHDVVAVLIELTTWLSKRSSRSTAKYRNKKNTRNKQNICLT